MAEITRDHNLSVWQNHGSADSGVRPGSECAQDVWSSQTQGEEAKIA